METKWVDPESGVEYVFLRMPIGEFEGVRISPCPGDTLGNEFCTLDWLWQSGSHPAHIAAREWASGGPKKTLWEHLLG